MSDINRLKGAEEGGRSGEDSAVALGDGCLEAALGE